MTVKALWSSVSLSSELVNLTGEPEGPPELHEWKQLRNKFQQRFLGQMYQVFKNRCISRNIHYEVYAKVWGVEKGVAA